MKEIKPIYVSFEQAKLLKEKGFDINSDYNQWLLAKDKGDDSKKFICHSNDLEKHTYIDDETEHNVYHCLSIPEQWQVIEWLRVNHGIHITHEWDYSYSSEKEYYFYKIKFKDSEEFIKLITGESTNSPQKAYSAAFDYILKKLL